MKRKIIIIILSILIALCLVFGLLKLWVSSNKNKDQIAVLMYHQIVYDENYNGEPDTVTVSMFEKQLSYLKEKGYKTLTLDEFYCWKKGKCDYDSKSILLTFDDGFYSFHYLAEPLLEKYDMHAVNFLIGSTIKEKTNDYDATKYGTIGLDLINNHSDNVEYQSHSYNLHRMDGQQIIYSLTKKELQEDIDSMNSIYDFKYIAYPFNTDTDEMIELLKENNYKLAFRGESEKVTKDCNDYQISRIGAHNNMDFLKKIVETDYYNNRYGNGLLRKIFITVERKLNVRLFN